jgi:hypothetical protein
MANWLGLKGAVHSMTIPRIEVIRPAEGRRLADEAPPQLSNDNARRLHGTDKIQSQRKTARMERDAARGYSINVKQVILAFAIEFLIIGLILTSQYLIAAEQGPRVFEALLFPIALAMVELARVPLAIAVRTQHSWNIKLAAALGVASAIVVTSFSLSTIAYRTFDPRLTQANDTHNDLLNLAGQRPSLAAQIATSQGAVEQKTKERDSINDNIKSVTSQLTAQQSQTCATVSVPNPNPQGPPLTTQSCRVNPVLKPLQLELAAQNLKLKEFEVALKQAQVQAERARDELVQFDGKLGKAEANYRETINHSQLHSYTAMLFRKDPRDVSDGEVKTLEWYLVVVPSIAAAFASTLIAITAVRRIPADPINVTPIPDEAAAYLFGPLLAAIKTEARATVSEAMSGRSKAASSIGG